MTDRCRMVLLREPPIVPDPEFFGQGDLIFTLRSYPATIEHLVVMDRDLTTVKYNNQITGLPSYWTVGAGDTAFIHDGKFYGRRDDVGFRHNYMGVDITTGAYVDTLILPEMDSGDRPRILDTSTHLYYMSGQNWGRAIKLNKTTWAIDDQVELGTVEGLTLLQANRILWSPTHNNFIVKADPSNISKLIEFDFTSGKSGRVTVTEDAWSAGGYTVSQQEDTIMTMEGYNGFFSNPNLAIIDTPVGSPVDASLNVVRTTTSVGLELGNSGGTVECIGYISDGINFLTLDSTAHWYDDHPVLIKFDKDLNIIQTYGSGAGAFGGVRPAYFGSMHYEWV